MDKNPFSSEIIIKSGEHTPHKLDFYSGIKDIPVVDIGEIQQLSKKERSKFLFEFIGQKAKNYLTDTVKKVTNPILSKTQDTTAFLMAQKSNLSGDETAEIYQLLNLLSNKRPYVGLKAATLLEKKVINPQVKHIVQNYFKFNPDAQVKYPRLNLLLKEPEDHSE